jgi:putative ABC transport system ATP-binding protein
MTLILMRDVTKDYRWGETIVPALKGITLEIDAGEFVAVWGPSGSGKTTLLNLMAGIDEPTSGDLSFNGRSLLDLSDNQKTEWRGGSVGFIFQRFNLIPVLSALENVMLALQIQGMPGAQAKKTAMARLEQLGLSGFVKHRPDKLSGGQQQRVAIARALVTHPCLVIADEPTANVDTDTAMMIVELMRDLNRKEETTFLFSTHDQRLLARVDRRIRLEDGRICGEERHP